MGIRTWLRAPFGWIVLASVGCSVQVMAHPSHELHQHLAQQPVTLQQAAERVVQVQGGEVLKAEPVELNGRKMYRVRLIRDGHVREVLVDATSGELESP